MLGLEDGSAGDRDELFSAWRLFFERLADRYPTVMVFEDIQWADTSLLDFIEYLLEWSRNSPLFVMTWYVLATLVVVGLGALAGYRLLRW